MHVCAVENCRRECFIDSGVYLKVEEEIPGKMSGKTVVLSYLGRNKKVFIPANETEGDFVFLRKKVIELFDFKCQRNVKLDITFQKHDDEVDEYIDIEKDEEDEVDKIQQKDKLKVIVTPSLTDDTPDGSTTVEVCVILMRIIVMLVYLYCFY